MAKYLNLAGLQTLWTKAKNTFATKTDLDNKVSKSGNETIEGEKNFSFWRTLFTSSGRSTKRIIVGNDFRQLFIGISAAKDDGSGGNILLSELGGTENLPGGDKSIIYTSNRSTNYQFNGNAKTATSATSATTATNAETSEKSFAVADFGGTDRLIKLSIVGDGVGAVIPSQSSSAWNDSSLSETAYLCAIFKDGTGAKIRDVNAKVVKVAGAELADDSAKWGGYNIAMGLDVLSYSGNTIFFA